MCAVNSEYINRGQTSKDRHRKTLGNHFSSGLVSERQGTVKHKYHPLAHTQAHAHTHTHALKASRSCGQGLDDRSPTSALLPGRAKLKGGVP